MDLPNLGHYKEPVNQGRPTHLEATVGIYELRSNGEDSLGT